MQFLVQTAQQTIQAILAPALLISACGLLLLGLNNRYATVVGRLRALNDEQRRRIAHEETTGTGGYFDTVRLESIVRQVSSLLHRANFLRKALIFLWIGVFTYLFASLCLAAELMVLTGVFSTIAVIVFMIGVLSAAVGVLFALLDISLAHKVLILETEI